MSPTWDYPVFDAAFREEIEREAEHQLMRFSAIRASRYCGGSEIAAAAAMLGLDASNEQRFSPSACRSMRRLHPGIPYFPRRRGAALPSTFGRHLAYYA